MKKIEKAKQIEIEKLEAKILNSYCPHDYDMADEATSGNFMRDGDCEKCWNEEVEGGNNGSE